MKIVQFIFALVYTGLLFIIVYGYFYGTTEFFRYIFSHNSIIVSYGYCAFFLVAVYYAVLSILIRPMLSGFLYVFDIPTFKIVRNVNFWLPLIYGIYHEVTDLRSLTNKEWKNHEIVVFICLMLITMKVFIKISRAAAIFKSTHNNILHAEANELLSNKGASIDDVVKHINQYPLLAQRDKESIIHALKKD